MVGEQNEVSEAVFEYIQKVFGFQDKINSESLWTPTFQYFADEEALFNYISSSDYLRKDPGVCFGFQISL